MTSTAALRCGPDDGSRSLFETSRDRLGTIQSFSPAAFDAGSTNAFFTSFGTNGRSCGTCHSQSDAWTLSTTRARATAYANPADPLFAPVDGADCPPTDPQQPADATRSTMVTGYGLIRIELPIPPTADFSLVSATNPEGCAVAPGDPSIDGALFLFRRPLPSANLPFLSAVMWDGRETHQKIATGPNLTNLQPLLADLSSQDIDATLGHAQATSPLTDPALSDARDFEINLFTAQASLGMLELDRGSAHGGPRYLSDVLAPAFAIGQNDPFAPGFTSRIFDLYQAWEPVNGCSPSGLTREQAAIGRGEAIFNNRTFTIANVGGINSAASDPLANPLDPAFDQPVVGTCGTCHNAHDVGDHTTALPINIGVTAADPTDNNGSSIAGILDTAKLPVYTLQSGARTVRVTDPARALISGSFVDVGKTKGPVLRGLAARAPYFHNGSAKDLDTVVEFYDARFNIRFTEAEKHDLVEFLKAL
ncbi:MAG: hypothetical protein JST54_07190 [Deltaproteobacteria bacterium]|nr:hypothetical protein [Deltaproteobacteria bacterium]